MAYTLFECFVFIQLMLTAMWLVSLCLGRTSVIDAFWGPGFLFVSVFCLWRSNEWSATTDSAEGQRAGVWILLALVTAWALRLGTHLAWRVWHEPHEDRRYAAMRNKYSPGFWWKSVFLIFWLQGAVMWVVSLPLQYAFSRPASPPSWLLVAFSTGVWAIGFFFEAVGDWQLEKFRGDPANQDRVLNSGLWRLTRHPNYFGDFMVWWGFWIFSAALGASLWTVISPLAMSLFLMKISGVQMLERDIRERRPGYAEYVRSTSAFFPRWRRTSDRMSAS